MTTADALGPAIRRIRDEVHGVLGGLSEAPAEELEAFLGAVADAERVFVHGAGRSGLALRMVAMRLMHLGLDVHVVGETTAPAIRPGDLLLTASGSGTTGGVVRAAQTAVSVGARVAAITTAAASPLADLAQAVIVVPAAEKLDRSGVASAQYAGSLFEQSVVLLGDALFHALWQRSGATADEIWPRHANLE
ncbi:6-phospho-3-hexuloisomerase [Microbacterium oryzae]|uniref:6-phospho-3-hexuloisomerase n=1 Tax=Microbacterium oryzae TaxID=743009 RepID=UPI0025B1B37F|nr:6-phospho-3-hexuloisomerase [Microbacterium oryzae]MDN3311340.1 6-phospho-3-hexuloisomerase [Microbacterium oryzae]